MYTAESKSAVCNMLRINIVGVIMSHCPAINPFGTSHMTEQVTCTSRENGLILLKNLIEATLSLK